MGSVRELSSAEEPVDTHWIATVVGSIKLHVVSRTLVLV
jgi:hypothetical protein